MGSKTNTVTQTADPWGAAQPYLLDTMRQAQSLYGNAGSTVAPFNPYQTAAFDRMADIAGYSGPSPSVAGAPYGSAQNPNISGLLGRAFQFNNTPATGQGTTGTPVNENVGLANDVIGSALQGGLIGQNPYATAQNPYIGMNDLSGVTDYITNAASRAVGDRFTAAGRSGSPAEQATLAKTISRELAPYAFGAQESALGRSFTGAENQINRGFSDYATGIQNQLRAAQFAPQLAGQTNELSLFGPRLLADVGQQYQSQDAAYRTAPYSLLSNFYSPIVQGTAGLGGTSIQETPGPSRLGGALGGAASGAALGAQFPVLGPLTPVAGGILGGIGGLF